MTEELTKEQIERRIFEALAPLVGMDVVPGSIRQLTPPAPDIECETRGSGPKAVELVALDAPHTRMPLRTCARLESHGTEPSPCDRRSSGKHSTPDAAICA